MNARVLLFWAGASGFVLLTPYMVLRVAAWWDGREERAFRGDCS